MRNFVWMCTSLISIIMVEGSDVGSLRVGSPIKALSPRVLSVKATATTCQNIYGPICGDCNTLWTCLGKETPFKTQNCEKTYPGKPYCVDGACSISPDPNDKECTTTGITCTATGYFPNPLNCSQYFFCEGPDGLSDALDCPPNYVYNSATNTCKRKNLSTDCATINCASDPDRYVAYAADPIFYALCLVTDGVTTPIMFKCADSKNEKFIQSQRRCVFQCKDEGKVPDAKDCSKYYECYRSGTSYTNIHRACLKGFIFSTETNGCVKGKCPVVEEETGEGEVSKGGEGAEGGD